MNIEILEFYEVSRNDEKKILLGTIRVRLTDLGIDILGIYITRKNKSFYFNMPSRLGKDHVTKKSITYPVFVFSERDNQRKFMNSLIKKGTDYLNDYLNGKNQKNKEDVKKEINEKPKFKEFITPPLIKKRARKSLK